MATTSIVFVGHVVPPLGVHFAAGAGVAVANPRSPTDASKIHFILNAGGGEEDITRLKSLDLVKSVAG